jgi:hypothetical protein
MGPKRSTAPLFDKKLMLTGHFAITLIGKRIEPKLSLGTLVLASMLCDLLWCAFMIAGVEQVRVKPGVTSTAGMRALDALEASEIAYSHSLLTTVLWSTILAFAFFTRRRNSRAAWIVFGAVLSHWFLDFISHPPDMPFLPGEMRRVGLGLWKSVPATLIIEGALWVTALVVYVRLPHRHTQAGSYVFWIGAVLLTAAWVGNIAGSAPTNVSTIGYTSGTFFLLTVVWAYWVNRLRTVH